MPVDHPTAFPHAATLVPAVIVAVSDNFYKISSETLVVLQQLGKVKPAKKGIQIFHCPFINNQVLRPLDLSPTTSDFTPYNHNIY